MDGARARFSEIYLEYHSRVWAYAARRVGRAAADDVAAEVFTVAWRRLAAMPSEPLPWLYGVARNIVARNRTALHRDEATRAALEFERPGVQRGAEGDGRVWDAWARLAERDREVLALVAWEELRVRDAAAVLGVTAAQFSVRLHRARRRLERLLEIPAPSPQTSTRSEPT